MNPEDWDEAHRNTNSVRTCQLFVQNLWTYSMQSLHEKDKIFALQYIADEDGYKITYKRLVNEEKCSQNVVRRRQQKNNLH